MNRIIFSLFLSAIFFVGCKNKIDDKLEKEIIRTLEENNKMLITAKDKIKTEFVAKSNVLEYRDKAKIGLLQMQVADSLLKEFLSALKNIETQNIASNDTIVSLFNSYRNNIIKIDSSLKDNINKFIDETSNSEEKITTKSQAMILSLYKNKATVLNNFFINECSTQFCFLPIYYK